MHTFTTFTWYKREWDATRPWFPHRCVYTGKWILPGKEVMRCRISTNDGPSSFLSPLDYVALWTTKEEFLFQKLKSGTT